MNKKILLAVAVVVALAAVIGLGSLAFFNARATQSDTFLVAVSDGQGGGSFSIAVSETTGDSYPDAYPGKVFAKDPVIRNTGAYKEWVRVFVTIDKADAWKALLGDDFALDALCDVNNNDFVLASRSESGGKVVFLYYLRGSLDAGASRSLFTTVTIPPQATIEDMDRLDGFTISIRAQAVQVEHNGNSAQEAEGWPA